VAWIPLAALNPAHEPHDGDGTGRTDFWLWFDRFARELPDRQREVLILRYQRDLDDESIGEILGVSTSGVRSLVARACAGLRSNPEIWR
jgi:RNA polymerase sigma factor (sigma-70 family)